MSVWKELGEPRKSQVSRPSSPEYETAVLASRTQRSVGVGITCVRISDSFARRLHKLGVLSGYLGVILG
jgi:hypothetical protein